MVDGTTKAIVITEMVTMGVVMLLGMVGTVMFANKSKQHVLPFIMLAAIIGIERGVFLLNSQFFVSVDAYFRPIYLSSHIVLVQLLPILHLMLGLPLKLNIHVAVFGVLALLFGNASYIFAIASVQTEAQTAWLVFGALVGIVWYTLALLARSERHTYDTWVATLCIPAVLVVYLLITVFGRSILDDPMSEGAQNVAYGVLNIVAVVFASVYSFLYYEEADATAILAANQQRVPHNKRRSNQLVSWIDFLQYAYEEGQLEPIE